MRALVTGADGFVGRHLVAHLEAAGDTVVGIDRTGGPDLLDADGVAAAIGAAAPDAVYHLGGWSDVGASWEQPREALRVNAEGTLNVLLASHGVVGRVLVVSSADVYGRVTPDELPLTETSPFRPVTPYAASKVAADELGHQAWLGHGLEVVRVRAFNHIGPGQSDRFVCPALAQRVARADVEGHDVVHVGNLEPRRDFTDVRDVVRAYRLLVERGEPGEAYNVCTGRDLSIGELAEWLVALAGRPLRLEVDPALQRPVEVPVLRGDPAKLAAATGWQPQIPLEATLADVLAEWRQRVAGWARPGAAG
jgi:GDP-4-dehydro-6-deoxy-D-mannose reductase